jgi:uncharacterized membrane protein YgcG
VTRLLKILSPFAVSVVLMLGAPLTATASTPPVSASSTDARAAAVPGSTASGAPVLGLAGSVRAQVGADTSDFSFSLYAGEYFLDRDDAGHSTLRTVETFVAEFPDFDQNRGIIRAIPNDYDGVPLNTTVESVTDAQGSPVPYESASSGGFTELALGTDDFVRGTQTYTISYTQENVVRAFADTNDDELYWDTNGTGFDQPFATVAARVHVAPAIAPFLTGNTACYTGAQGESGECEITQEADPDAPAPAAEAPAPDAEASEAPDAETPDAASGADVPQAAPTAGQMFTAVATDLAAGENLTVAIGFTAGTFVQVPADAQSGSGFGETDLSGVPLGLLGLGGVGVAAALAVAFLRVREPKGRGTIIPQYSVPAGLNLLEAADLIGRPSAGVPAQIVSFAVRGNVRILDYPVTADGGDFTLQLLHTEGVDDQERAVLATLFPGLATGAVCELGVADSTLAAGLAAATRDATRRNIARGWRTRPRLTRGRTWLLVGLAAVLVTVVAVLALGRPPVVWWFPLILVGMTALIVGLIAGRRPMLLSATGVDQRDYLTGMKVYLDLAEADRFRMLQSPEGALRVSVPRTVPGQDGPAASAVVGEPGAETVELVKLYEKLLPYAVLWGVEKEWAAELAVYYEREAVQPGWLVSQNSFSGAQLGFMIGGMVNSVRTSQTPPAPTTSWSGSSGGSFSGGSFGGGFSGGGGGGGGGGGR